MIPRAASTSLEPHFLGWNSAILPKFAAFLEAHHGEDMTAVRVVLPGRRAARRLLEILLQRQSPAWAPPQFLTLAQLSDELTAWPHPRASDLMRQLAWLAALRQHRASLAALLPEPPAADDLPAWLQLAALLRRLHAQLAASGKRFDDVAALAHGLDRPRWQCLSELQQAYAQSLAAAGVGDPHLMRMEALESGSFQAVEGDIVLAGMVEASPLQAAILRGAKLRGHALIAAPAELAEGFDELGLPIADFWLRRPLSLAPTRIHDLADPAAEAEAIIAQLARQAGTLAGEDITLGLLSADTTWRVEQKLAAVGINLHRPQDKTLRDSTPLRLLRLMADWLSQDSPEALGALLRHADVEAALAHDMAHPPTPAALDAYLTEHLVNHVAPPWLGSTEDRLPAATVNLKQQSAQLWDWSKALRRRAQALPGWVEAVQAFLLQIYGRQEFNRNHEAEAQTAAALEACRRALSEWAALPAQAAFTTSFHGAAMLRLLAQQLENSPLPSAARREPSVDAVGWLELALDDAPALVVSDVHEGTLPAAAPTLPWLGAPLRARLGLDQDAQRLGRDRYLLQLLEETRRATGDGEQAWPQYFLSRTDPSGSPAIPSRLLFLGRPEERIAQATRSFAEAAEAAPAPAMTLPQAMPWPGQDLDRSYDKEHFSPSALNTYLESPYSFFLERVLKLEEVAAEPRELDALRYGSLLHEVLECYGRDSHSRELTEPEAIFRVLKALLQTCVERTHGKDCKPAVRMQQQQAELRLRHFAAHQAACMDAGWRIHEVEWAPPGDGVEVSFGGESFLLTGRVDRLDVRVHEGRQEWRIIDYKTANKPYDKKHCVTPRHVWKDVQMALYPFLTASLTGPARLGAARQDVLASYWNLSPVEKDHGLVDVSTAFDAEDFAALEEQLAKAVRGIRAGDFFDPQQRAPSYKGFTLRCMGQGLLASESQGDAEEDEEEAWA